MAKIVISYRRSDSQAITGRIFDRLVAHYGAGSIFIDVDSIPFGIDFRDYIKLALAETDIVLAVMGDNWLGQNPSGPARIMEETDPVRIEVETALARNIAVIPLLLDKATMPQVSELPESLANLAYRNAAHVDSGADFHTHMDRLIRSMDLLLGRIAEQRGGAAGAGAVAAAGATAAAAPSAGHITAQAAPPGVGAHPPPFQNQAPQITQMAPAQSPKGSGWVKWAAIAASVLMVTLGGALAYVLIAPRLATRTQVAQQQQPAPQPAQPQPAAPAAPAPVISGPPPKCSSGAAAAFQDNFGPPAAGWDEPSAARAFEDGEMVLRSVENRAQSWLYRPLRIKSGSICTVVKAPAQASKVNGKASGGLIFWAADYQNYYMASVYLDGTFQVYRKLANDWIPVVARTKSPHLRQGVGALNELQMTIAGNDGSFFANGQKLVEFHGQPPDKEGAFGFYGQAEADRGSEWRFTGVTVVDDAAPAARPASAKATRFATTPTDCKGDKEAAFADDFKKQDAGWGNPSGTAFYDGGTMVLKPQPNRYRTLLYRSLLYVNPTVCINMRWPAEGDEGPGGAGGIAFWAASYANFYHAKIYRDGSFDVNRYFHEEWLPIRRKTPAPAIRTAPDAVNQLKVQIVNNKATLTINDVKVLEFFGQRPAAGGSVGMVALADKERSATWRFTDLVVVD